ncbi:MAG TPA: DUF1015 family protein [Rhodocyclaceae bacterium]|nr:DUF1015 family protein [Rhodocyclaceae bacterium]
MPLIRPFAGLRPAAGRAAEVIAPPYDVLTAEEAKRRADGRPWSFLHISKPEIDLPEGTDPYAPQVYAKARENLDRMLAEGVLRRDAAPRYYVYRLATGEHVQTGLVAAASVADYVSNRIRRHELTRPDKEDDRVRQIQALSAQTGPVLLAHPEAPGIDGILAEAAAGPPAADAQADDGVRHTLWVIEDATVMANIGKLFEDLPALYIADGHHRSAAAARVAADRRGGSISADDAFLAVIFPHHQMRILDYNRTVADLNGMQPARFLARVAERFAVEEAPAPVSPGARGEFGLCLGGAWYRLRILPELIPADPVARLDVSLLSEHLLAPLLDIRDLRRDQRIDFVGGIRGLAELHGRVTSGQAAAAFSLHPTSMEDLMAVADAHQIMPPKSTWFEPKLADGMVSLVLN